jgi:hypothetical protein
MFTSTVSEKLDIVTKKIITMNNYIILLITLLSCNTSKKHDPMSNSYGDINMFTLKGIDSLKGAEIKYPFISIIEMDSQNRLIKYKLTPKVIYNRLYTKKEDYWECKYVLNDGRAKEFYTEYILPNNKIVITVFSGKNVNDTNNVLTQLQVHDAQSKIRYFYEDKYKPNFNNIKNYELLINQHIDKFINIIFYYVNTNLVIEEVQKDYKTKSIIWEQKNCYKVNSRSYFWWSYFGSNPQEGNCK